MIHKHYKQNMKDYDCDEYTTIENVSSICFILFQECDKKRNY